jgi:FkbM family methyltransferase
MRAMAPALLKSIQTRHGPMLALPRDKFITRCLEVYGEFSPGEWDLLAQVIKPGMTVVEIGANIGAHTVAMARACAPGTLYAFEPQQRVFQILCANLVLNDVGNVVAFPDACGAEPGWATMPYLDYAAHGNFGGVSLSAAGDVGERARVVALDELELPACGLVKVDVEGFEGQALSGAARTIARHRPVLYVENDRRQHQRALIEQIAAMGYALYWHTPPLARPGNFNGVEKAVFDRDYRSLNLLCLPQERNAQVQDLQAIDPLAPRLPRDLYPDMPLIADAGG